MSLILNLRLISILIIISFFVGIAQATVIPPTYINESETEWDTTTSPKTTSNFTVQTGDILVAYVICADPFVFDVSGGGLTWTIIKNSTAAGYTSSYIWIANATSNVSMNVVFTQSGIPAKIFGGNILVFRGSTGVGNSTISQITDAAPILNITTTQINSTIIVTNGDWAAIDGASRTWRNTTGTINETSYYSSPGISYTIYGGYHNDSGAVGVKTVGLSTPGAQTYTIIAVEILGTTVLENSYIPPSPISLTNTTGEYWVNHSWSAGSGNITDSYNVSVNGIWNNGSTLTYNNSSVGVGHWSNISIYAYNLSNTGTLNSTPVSMNTQAPFEDQVLVYNTGWQYLLINDTTTMSADGTAFGASWLAYWNSTSQKFELYKTGWPYHQSLSLAKGAGIMAIFDTNKTINTTANASYNWTLKQSLNLVGIE